MTTTAADIIFEAMTLETRYWAFLSYGHADKAWAECLRRWLETYRVPKVLVGMPSDSGAVIKPARLASNALPLDRPVEFRGSRPREVRTCFSAALPRAEKGPRNRAVATSPTTARRLLGSGCGFAPAHTGQECQQTTSQQR